LVNKEKIKAMYLEGKSVTEICAILGITRPTVYRHKKEDAAKGVDWDELLYLSASNIEGIELREKEFLSHLIKAFEKELDALESLPNAIKRLEVLDKYVKSYYRIKAPIKTDCSVQIYESLSLFVRELGALATQKGAVKVAEFLAENATFIIEKVQKLSKGIK
jgi:predicted transcriptional regulator